MEQQISTTAVQIVISILPIVGIVLGATLIFFYMLWHHREVKLQIKTGSFVQKNINFSAIVLLAGLTLTGVGLVISLVFAIKNGFSYALIPAVIGICLLIFYKVFPDFHKEK